METTKKGISVLLCLLLIFSCMQMSFCASAVPYTLNIGTTSCSLDISGITSTSTAKMIANSSMSLKIKMELQKLKNGTYTTVET